MKTSVGLFLLVLVVGCARTSISSLASPEIQGRSYDRIMVVVGLADIGNRTHGEEQFRSAYQADSTLLIPSHLILIPGREYTEAAMDSLITSHGIDAVLILQRSGSGEQESMTGSVSKTRCTTMSNAGCIEATTKTRDDVPVVTLWAGFRAELIDRQSGAVVWVATTKTEGSSLAGMNILLSSIAGRTVKQLIRDGVLK